MILVEAETQRRFAPGGALRIGGLCRERDRDRFLRREFHLVDLAPLGKTVAGKFVEGVVEFDPDGLVVADDPLRDHHPGIFGSDGHSPFSGGELQQRDVLAEVVSVVGPYGDASGRTVEREFTELIQALHHARIGDRVSVAAVEAVVAVQRQGIAE